MNNTTITSNIHPNYIYTSPSKPSPFNIKFSWGDREVNVSLKTGDDIFKLANAFMEWLDKNDIEYNIKTKGRKKKQ